MLKLDDTVSKLHLLKPEHEQALNKLGIQTVRDLLYYFPRDWQDLSEIKKISDIRPAERINIRARVKQISSPGFPFRRVKITEALLEDDSGNVVAVWFNQPYIKNSLHTGKEYYFSGKGQLYQKRGRHTLQLAHPTFEMVKTETIHTAGIIPVYQLTEGITEKQIRYWIKQALEGLSDVTDLLPQKLRTKLGLVGHSAALQNLHFPQNEILLAQAKKRLTFEELFLFQLAFQLYKKTLKNLPSPPITFNNSLVSKFVESLPFKLTPSQRLAAWEILRDISRPHPMNRLLEGEVGSGKTVVAGLSMLEVASSGYQSVMLAPTEILALQHYETLKNLFAHTEIETALLTRSHKIGSLSKITSGHTKVIVGTHALLQEKVIFNNIGLLVVDEQHRFGVKQRAKLQNTSADAVPHLLSMTATPIPRTLALAFYGDLDISILRELPRGRKKTITKLVKPEGRDIAYKFIKQELKKGQQAYIVVPLVDPSPLDKSEGQKATTEEVKKLRTIFPEFTIGMLHGRLHGEEKKQIMDDFKSGKINILVSTTVIEVGVDVGNATIMVIENAERFGLAQLHQLRGRVGRSNLQSYCLLFAENAGETTRERLEAVVNSTDGFELAEIDLRLRGSGEILGTRQSGFIPFKIASLSDTKNIELAKKEAIALLENDDLKNYPDLAAKVSDISRQAHLE
ncbi:MAG: ATP-dependent DNA helicase RecG [Candidatus Doudnabacteria bacterium RIFCSPHIGHO2_02_FULL_48_21]|nr:MAG: ATP-dependent DNA helicase RecG [Candidatus Doudnabacteria bacterium RIFCSPHIGHO2_01_48_18]OGE91900.1 MAG: ATP-dependent DNA helicase RecG [Candidatus Doudnabacteria bacterium RIFCSPHIGHO2_12_FULL_47_25]OGE93496.1 MAG: ATP-dependent DNA helicase RecG [Candidatus Doudnabacteria bacterium RIFCSPHIGHO2_02_FULL_48_21]OGE97875.1 MAG: ATP-dependent DNA helicase RecG [Candidatus Doudnabacteria bacterium RIFCSPLOWO2_01_FULL_48_57]OGF02210.1 MAG: ATP-dependent DNA helicase RecG [Candidatus Doudn